jgi:hypothetical protein
MRTYMRLEGSVRGMRINLFTRRGGNDTADGGNCRRTLCVYTYILSVKRNSPLLFSSLRIHPFPSFPPFLKQRPHRDKPGLRGLPTRVALFLWAFSRQGATGFPLFTTWDSVAGSGRAPIPGNISGRSRPRNNTQCSRSAVGRPLGQRWILGAGLRAGGPGRSPFWRTPEEFCTVRNSAR